MSGPRTGRNLVVAAGFVIAAAVLAALSVTGMPGEQRILRMDERRVDDLQAIEAAVQDHAHQRGRLPASLQGLAEATHRSLRLVDPDTGAGYEYVAVDARRYRLCAEFARDSRRPGGAPFDPVQGWQHPAGRHCFDRALPSAVVTERDVAAPG